jgi:hypothetical protein
MDSWEPIDDSAMKAGIVMDANVVRCPICQMPLSRPLCAESHLPNCWFRGDLEALKASGKRSGAWTVIRIVGGAWVILGIWLMLGWITKHPLR